MQSLMVPFGCSARGAIPLPSQEVQSEGEQQKWSVFSALLLCLAHLVLTFKHCLWLGFSALSVAGQRRSSFINYAPALRYFNVSISEKFYPCLWKIWFLFHLNGWGLLRYFLQFWRKAQQFSQALDINNIVYAVSTLVVLCLCRL